MLAFILSSPCPVEFPFQRLLCLRAADRCSRMRPPPPAPQEVLLFPAMKPEAGAAAPAASEAMSIVSANC